MENERLKTVIIEYKKNMDHVKLKIEKNKRKRNIGKWIKKLGKYVKENDWDCPKCS